MASERLHVLHRDSRLVALAKPAGLPSVPDDSGDASLLELAEGLVGGALHVVHRLDRPVSGVIVFARDPETAALLSAALRRRTLDKRYWAVAEGIPRRFEGVLVQHLRKDGARNLVASVSEGAPGSKRAETAWRVLFRLGERALLELVPRTGRSHQLRVAAAKLGCPLVGDVKYGASRLLADLSIGLHARSLSLPAPSGGDGLELVAPLPPGNLWNLGRRWLEQSGTPDVSG